MVAHGICRVSQDFEALTNLTSLFVGNIASDKASACLLIGKGCEDLSMIWKSLQALQTLYVLCCFTCDQRVFGLADLQQLMVADFLKHSPIMRLIQNCWGPLAPVLRPN